MIYRLKVKQVRLLRNMSQEELAIKSGVEQPFISKIENGYKEPNIKTLCHIARALNVKPGDLIEIEGR